MTEIAHQWQTMSAFSRLVVFGRLVSDYVCLAAGLITRRGPLAHQRVDAVPHSIGIIVHDLFNNGKFTLFADTLHLVQAALHNLDLQVVHFIGAHTMHFCQRRVNRVCDLLTNNLGVYGGCATACGLQGDANIDAAIAKLCLFEDESLRVRIF